MPQLSGTFNGWPGEFYHCVLVAPCILLTQAHKLYSHVSRGWPAIYCMRIGILGICMLLSFAFPEDLPLLSRLRRWGKGEEDS